MGGQLGDGRFGQLVGGDRGYRVEEHRQRGPGGDIGIEADHRLVPVADQGGGGQHQHSVGAGAARLGYLRFGEAARFGGDPAHEEGALT